MSVNIELHREKFGPHVWRRLLKMSAVYAQSFEARVCGGDVGATRAGGERILRLTLSRIVEGRDGYAFRDGDILFFHYLCRCCRKTALELRDAAPVPAATPPSGEGEDDEPVTLTERAALAFLQRRQALAQFQAFAREQKLKGKLRAYCAGLEKYAADGDAERIARDLRVTVETLGRYRSRLRDLLEDFEGERLSQRQV